MYIQPLTAHLDFGESYLFGQFQNWKMARLKVACCRHHLQMYLLLCDKSKTEY